MLLSILNGELPRTPCALALLVRGGANRDAIAPGQYPPASTRPLEEVLLPWLWIALIGTVAMSIVTFFAFGIDKWKAKRNRWRIPEATLLLFAFLLGAPGAWLGSKTFRHKTVKTSFRLKLLLVTVVNPLWLLLWLEVTGRW